MRMLSRQASEETRISSTEWQSGRSSGGLASAHQFQSWNTPTWDLSLDEGG